MGYRRAKAELYFEILKAIEEANGEFHDAPAAKPTRVQGKVNISYDRFKRYIRQLRERGLLEAIGSPESQTFRVSEKGQIYIIRYEIVADFLRTFNL